MAKKVSLASKWKPPQQIKLPEREMKKSKFYLPSPDKEADDVFMTESLNRTSRPIFDDRIEFDVACEKFFKKYSIPDEGKIEFAEMFMNKEREEEPRKGKSKRLPLHSTSSVGITSSPRYRHSRMSLPSLSTSSASSSHRYQIPRRKTSAIETFQSYESMQSTDVTPVDDGSCVFHHRCRSTVLDQPLNQFQISVGSSSTIVIADSNTIILHGQNAELVSQYEKIALKLFFNMNDEIITRMVNANFLEDLCELILEKGATPLEIGKGCVELWLSFARTDTINTFMDELKKGKLRNELARLLLRHGYINDDKELTISIKDKKVDKVSLQGIGKGIKKDTVFDKDMNEGALDPINFMMSAFWCTNLEQLDTVLSRRYEERIPVGGFTEHFQTSDNTFRSKDVKRDVPASNTLFPTLLHFAAFHGLPKLCACLIDTPGYSEAVSMTNKDGLTPVEMVPVDKPNIKNVFGFK
ncbi:uncharacterized protein LOC117121831 [Anneissia japonica]|uniref:uncharacterized protein LOC117121831 n=1 Tax=Anneissia japonica TaxID=1529436 RepID=UPI00142582AD|nr:uncharacterized protein LOC117121831 [Anneissia japonica]XP_033123091.1 uncharacterized protein LOC117121831 [Anneissia japonica]XP_033123092.1 uncharacterized protein LOC117121831 [Anneissia japonica]XP_033123093.1 uncharacterized protein LOC117121831 [Anneissia japonica]XP_033123094.1 uncharacterized protein LOC117121831 [Anneissia japonica]XP_033123095.1 uncharacterized protein LOC117121831 [Anneissia japonica]